MSVISFVCYHSLTNHESVSILLRLQFLLVQLITLYNVLYSLYKCTMYINVWDYFIAMFVCGGGGVRMTVMDVIVCV